MVPSPVWLNFSEPRRDGSKIRPTCETKIPNSISHSNLLNVHYRYAQPLSFLASVEDLSMSIGDRIWIWRPLLIVATLGILPATSCARPAHKKAVADYLGAFLPKHLNSCTLCHLPDAPDAKKDDDKPHNPFGERLAAVRKELQKAGKKTDLPSRLEAIADEDADRDGAANLLEILAGHNPGDPKDIATKEELAAAVKTLAAFREKQKDYRWRPFESVVRPPLPEVKNKAWMHSPIDAFLAAEHERRGLTPRPEAPRHVLVRRLSLDLIGLPPTPEEVAAFVNDTAPDAYDQLVERLLTSPHYGERWGRHWMDVWRYSDWAGYGAEVRDSQPHIWRWRDWIVESLNEDKPYDRMVREMLAGDELAPTDQQTLRATGFLVRNWYKFNRDIWLDRTVEHTGKAFLGLTINCARCHDHFFDPISQEEYYRFRAFFEPHDIRVDKTPGGKDGLVRVYDAKAETPTFLYVRGEEKRPDKTNPLSAGVLSCLGMPLPKIEPIKLPPAAIFPEKQEWLMQDQLKAARMAIEQAKAGLAMAKDHELAKLDVEIAEAKLRALETRIAAEKLDDGAKQKDAALTKASETQRTLGLAEARKAVRVAKLAADRAKDKTATQKKLAEAQAALAKLEDAKAPTIKTGKASPYPATSTGRRSALARWITDRQNPLAARVAVNHIWQRHFGTGLVPSMFDFGANGQPATHPALLDWLAAELMDPTFPGRDGDPSYKPAPWSMKHLHRLIVTSAAYRMDSTTEPADVAKDRDNFYYWRANVRRMEAEIVRDSVLAVGGQLDRTFGGPELDHKLGLTTNRRSIYYRYAPEKMMEFLTLFDSANVVECYQRTESVIPQQALAMANSSMVLTQARHVAKSLERTLGPKSSPAAFISASFDRVLGRPASSEERAACEQFLSEQAALLANPKTLTPFAGKADPGPTTADPQLRARENLIHVLLNHSDFVTIR